MNRYAVQLKIGKLIRIKLSGDLIKTHHITHMVVPRGVINFGEQMIISVNRQFVIGTK